MSENRRSANLDDGFTLTELIVVIAIIGLVSATLALSISTFLRNEGSVSARVTETRDLQNLTNFLPRDVGSARSIVTAPTDATRECGSGGEVVLHFEWAEEWRGVLHATRVTYRKFTAPSNRLVRFECENSNPALALKLADVYTTAAVTIAVEPPPDDTIPTGTVTVDLTFADGTVRSITGTSRNFLPPLPAP